MCSALPTLLLVLFLSSKLKNSKLQRRDERGQRDEKSTIFPCYKRPGRPGEPRAYSTNIQVSGVSYPLPHFGKTFVSKNYYYEDSSFSSWGFSDLEIKRRKRIALYKPYGVEGKMKASLRGGFRWVKNRARRFLFFLLNWAKSKILHLGKKFVIFA